MKDAIFILIIVSSCLVCLHVTNSKRNTFSTDLIHRDSQLSPLYNTSLTSPERLRKTVLRSFSPVNKFRSNLHLDAKYTESAMFYDKGDYLMKISIGNGHKVIALVNTGSDLTWINCDLSKQEGNHQTISQLFKPNNSGTYFEVPYTDTFCKDLSESWPGSSDECRYKYSYEGGGYTSGILSRETFTLGSLHLDPPKLVFGCSDIIDIEVNSLVQGFVGLGGGHLSLTSQLSDKIDHKFSYCLVPRPALSDSKLILGDQQDVHHPARVTTNYTLKPPHDPYYYLRLEGISIVGTNADQMLPYDKDIIIDSGKYMTLLHSTTYDLLEKIIWSHFCFTPKSDKSGTFFLCFRTEKLADKTFPVLKFHFKGAVVELKRENTFVQHNRLTCLAIAPHDGTSIFGNIAQTNFVVGYDLFNRTISFTPIDCSLY